MRVRLLGPEILHFGTSAKQKKKFQKGTLLSSGEMSGALAPPSVYFCTLLIKKLLNAWTVQELHARPPSFS